MRMAEWVLFVWCTFWKDVMASTPQPSAELEHTDVELVLHYRHGWGELAPYFKGLQRGQLLGARCQDCQSLWIPPRRRCRCGGAQLAWETHSASGTVQGMTDISAHAVGQPSTQARWVLVRFDGAQALALAQYRGDCEPALSQRVQMVGCGESAHEMPALIVQACLPPSTD